MKRFGYYALILAIVWMMSSGDRTEIGDLTPVEVIQVKTEADRIKVITDTEDVGQGQTVKEAFEDLKATTAGVVYLDTADFVLLSEGTVELIPELREHVKRRARVCMIEGEIDLKDAAAYLAVHNPRSRINSVYNSKDLEILKEKEGRIILEEKDKKALDKVKNQ